MDGVGVGLAHVLVGELGHGKGGGTVLGGGDVLERGRALVGGGGGELERLAGLGGGAVDGLAHRELELAGGLLVGVVEERRGTVGRDRGVRDGAGRERAVAPVGADRDDHGHVVGHGPAHRGGRGLMNEVLVGLAGVCQAELDLAEGGAGGAHRRRDVSLGHGGALGHCLELEVESLVVARGLAVHGLGDGEGRGARGDVGVVERGSVGAVCVLDGLDLEVAAVAGVADRDGGLDVGGVGPACARSGGLAHGVAVGAGCVEGELAELGGAGALDGDLVAHLLAGLVEQSEGKLPGEALNLLAVDGLVHRERGACGLGLVGVVELGDVGAGGVSHLGSKDALGVALGGNLHRCDDVGSIRPTLRGCRELVDRVGVGLAGVLVGELRHGKGGTTVLISHNVGENRGVLIGADGTELERLARLGSLAVDGLCELELELARGRDVGVVERSGVGAVGVGHVALERAVTVVRNTHGHSHVGSGRPAVCVAADLVHDIGERLARSVNVVRDGVEARSAADHGGGVGKGLADPIALLVGLIETEREALALADLGAAVDSLAH